MDFKGLSNLNIDPKSAAVMAGLSPYPTHPIFCMMCGRPVDLYSPEEVKTQTHLVCAQQHHKKMVALKQQQASMTYAQSAADEEKAFNDGEDFSEFENLFKK